MIDLTDWWSDPLGILRLWRQARRWIALKEMGGLNPFFSPSLAHRVFWEKQGALMREAMLEQGKRMGEGISAGMKPISHRHFKLMIDLIDWRRGGY